MELSLKNFIIKEFKEHNIPSGYHTFNYVNNNSIIIMTLKADNSDHSYTKRITTDIIKNKLIEWLLVDRVNVELSDSLLTVKVNLQDYNEYRIKLRDEYPNIHKHIQGTLDHKKLYQQVKMHRIKEVDQHLYNLIASKDDNYYNDLYLDHWNTGHDSIDLSNDEIIKGYPQYLSYDNIVYILSNKELFNFVINNFDFNNPQGNYTLLSKLIENKNIENIDTLIKVFTVFEDQGILVSVIKHGITMNAEWRDLFNLLFNWELTKRQDYIDILFNQIIESNCIYTLTILLKNGVHIKQNYLFLAKELKRDKIHCLLCNHLD